MFAQRIILVVALLAVTCSQTFADPPTSSKPIPITPEVAVKLRDIAFQAAREGDLKTLDAYFASGLSVNEPNARGDTLLTVAAYNGQTKAVDVILAQPKVAVDARNKMGLTALTAASFKGHTEIAERLVRAKADVNAANGSGTDGADVRCLDRTTKTVEYLLMVGANASAADTSGNTALSLARDQGADAVVQLLVSRTSTKSEDELLSSRKIASRTVSCDHRENRAYSPRLKAQAEGIPTRAKLRYPVGKTRRAPCRG